MPSAQDLPRWRGFNLLPKFSQSYKADRDTRFSEWDFRKMQEWGFDFARLPMDYRLWSKDGDWRVLDEAVLGEIDDAVELGKKYGFDPTTTEMQPGTGLVVPRGTVDRGNAPS